MVRVPAGSVPVPSAAGIRWCCRGRCWSPGAMGAADVLPPRSGRWRTARAVVLPGVTAKPAGQVVAPPRRRWRRRPRRRRRSGQVRVPGRPAGEELACPGSASRACSGRVAGGAVTDDVRLAAGDRPAGHGHPSRPLGEQIAADSAPASTSRLPLVTVAFTGVVGVAARVCGGHGPHAGQQRHRGGRADKGSSTGSAATARGQGVGVIREPFRSACEGGRRNRTPRLCGREVDSSFRAR